MKKTLWGPITTLSVLDIAESQLQKSVTNLCLQRNSYINRVYEIELAESKERFIMKFYRPGRWTKDMILDEHDLLNTLFKKKSLLFHPVNLTIKHLN